jgi:hypothetical protein
VAELAVVRAAAAAAAAAAAVAVGVAVEREISGSISSAGYLQICGYVGASVRDSSVSKAASGTFRARRKLTAKVKYMQVLSSINTALMWVRVQHCACDGVEEAGELMMNMMARVATTTVATTTVSMATSTTRKTMDSSKLR